VRVTRNTITVGLAFGLTLLAGNAQAAASSAKELEQRRAETKSDASLTRPSKSFPAVRPVDRSHAVVTPQAPLVVLYDQTDSPDANAYSSQNFEAAYDAYDNQGADDFVVTGAGWNVTTVVTPGAYFNGLGPANSLHVTFYADAGGAPGAALPGCDYPAVTTFVDSPSGSFTTTLTPACGLTVGTKWVSVQVNMDFGVGGQWGWTMRDVQSGSPAVWQNPGGGFGSGCAAYAPRTGCDATTAASPDNAFRLEGTFAGCNTDADCQDGNLCNGVETCVLGVCAPGTPVNCDDGLFCTIDACAPGTGLCSHAPNLCSDGDGCTVDFCDEAADTCTHLSPTPVHVCNTGAITIPDSGTGTPYPSTIAVAGLGNTASLCSVQLLGLSHTFPDDIDLLLVGPAAPSPNAIIMSDVGGGTDAVNLNLTLKDAAASSLPDNGPLVSGTFKPTNVGAGDTFAGAPAPSGGSVLSAFDGQNPNGNWSLYVVDDAGGDSGSFAGGWCVDIIVTGCNSDADCNDGNLCNGAETCVAGACTPGTSINCDDGQFCTIDSCDPSTGNCLHAPNPCSDGVPCTTDTCDEDADVCVHTNTCLQVCNTGAITINDSTTPPTIATPYPAPITISGAVGIFSLVSVDLTGINHTFPDDIDILLTAPNTPTNAVIMSDVGGGAPGAVNVNLSLTDGAPSIPDAGPLVSGTYSPTNIDPGTGTEAWPAPAPLPSGGSALSQFNGTNPNGDWNLFVVDDQSIDSGTITGGWCINYRLTCNTAVDCDDADPCTTDSCVNSACTHSALGTPGLVAGVSASSDKQTISWTADANSTRYDAVRGSLAALPVGPGDGDEVCFDNLLVSAVVDPATPAPGDPGFWYLIRGENSCTDGSFGTQSDLTPRITTTCP
jgi:subtilisin-like proprotein convertase family protein